MRNKTKLFNQKGLVSFMVTLIMMMVISLIVIGFTQVSNRNRREALDRQLSAQAFYAAESGVNQAIEDFYTQITNGSTDLDDKSDCSNSGMYYDSFELDGSNVAVTCIMVNTRPKSIVGSATQNSSFVSYINPTNSSGGSTSLNSLTFSWKPDVGQTPTVSGCTGGLDELPEIYPPSCAFGLLRVDLFQHESINDVPNAGNVTTLYLRPFTGAESLILNNSTVLPDSSDSYIVDAECDADDVCRVTVGFDQAPQTKKYFARLSSIYRDIPSFEITGTLVTGGGSDPAYFEDAQAVIDSTGRAQDVLRRVQVRYSLGGGDQTPPWAVAGRVCKKLKVMPPPSFAATNDLACNYTP